MATGGRAVEEEVSRERWKLIEIVQEDVRILEESAEPEEKS